MLHVGPHHTPVLQPTTPADILGAVRSLPSHLPGTTYPTRVIPGGWSLILVLLIVAFVAIAPAFDGASASESQWDGHTHCLLHGNPAVLAEPVSLQNVARRQARLPLSQPDPSSIRAGSIFVPPRF